ncbi:hypothetical protein Ocin01_13790 [Orchesella cincta]|uniref:Uncharacterized protein n=1 Tax=Orchesella cincta TaxID=48709 RepID=A0A1D2MJ05_ORCCI|nr:hypothetical protein Ocin01_13790 [Orchesella cincta]
MVRFMSIRLNGLSLRDILQPTWWPSTENGFRVQPVPDHATLLLVNLAKGIKDSVLTDPKSRHMWKPFKPDFNPDEEML